MNWELALQIGEFMIAVVGVIGGTAGVYYWKAYKKEKEANAQTAKIEAMSKEADFAETMLQKFEKTVIGRMDQGEAVRKKEFDQLRIDLGGQLTNIQAENRKQNETIAAQNDRISEQNDLLQDIKEYLNGGFAAFEANKHAQKPTNKTKR